MHYSTDHPCSLMGFACWTTPCTDILTCNSNHAKSFVHLTIHKKLTSPEALLYKMLCSHSPKMLNVKETHQFFWLNKWAFGHFQPFWWCICCNLHGAFMRNRFRYAWCIIDMTIIWWLVISADTESSLSATCESSFFSGEVGYALCKTTSNNVNFFHFATNPAAMPVFRRYWQNSLNIATTGWCKHKSGTFYTGKYVIYSIGIVMNQSLALYYSKS